MIHRQALIDYLTSLLEPNAGRDYCPNGLQVEGKAHIQRLITGVTASKRLLQRAIDANADAVLVHHGYFWKGEEAAITGMKAQRIKLLIENELNLLAYHLPLDIHPQFGNNACLGALLGVECRPPVSVGGVDGLLWHGRLPEPISPSTLSARLADGLGQSPVHIEVEVAPIKTIAWCSGGGQKFIQAAAALEVDAYISGEISEQTTHEARELGLHYFAAGHHATERAGVKTVGEHLADQFEIEHEFIDDPNPA
ncbi:MAG: Nif3-like dinuclear metal center hexameric protein [Spiribacter sp.]|jgi:dinuclear metal center YbgI/SA1388 family protein|nr:Nif3-like dinuclear metal center hexameric protein [Spiribacter sp.]MDR9489480.1 Nif3-like dinuclear metal center hexameric protein [Spiribacter sp.]